MDIAFRESNEINLRIRKLNHDGREVLDDNSPTIRLLFLTDQLDYIRHDRNIINLNLNLATQS